MMEALVPDRLGRRDGVALVALSGLAVGIPLWLAAAAGAIGLPSNDDWVYMRAASSLFETGSIEISGHTTAFVGQLVLAQPFLWLSGGDPWAFTAFGLLMSWIGVAATYLLARRFVGTGSAVFTVLLVIAFPGFVRESASFMTDVPAFAFGALCLLLGTRYLGEDGGRLTLAASILTGLLAVGIREFALAAPVAILAVAWARNRPEERVLLAALSGLLAAGVVGILALVASTPGHGAPASPELWRLIYLGPAFATLSAALLPVAILHVGRRMATFRPEPFVIGAGLACLLVVLPNGPLVGNQWTSQGFSDDQILMGTRAPVFDVVAWALSRQLAVFAAILVAAVAISWGQRNVAIGRSLPAARTAALRIARSDDAPILLFLVAYSGELVLFGFVGLMFDRYLYPLIPVAAILLLRGPAQPFRLTRSHAFSHLSFAWLAASAFVIAANSFAYDTGRFREGEAAVAMGYDPATIDAGYEWVGTHAVGPEKRTLEPTNLTWWDSLFMSTPACAVLSNSELEVDGYRLIRVNPTAYRQFLFVGTYEPLYLYGAVLDGCPPAPPAVSTSTAP